MGNAHTYIALGHGFLWASIQHLYSVIIISVAKIVWRLRFQSARPVLSIAWNCRNVLHTPDMYHVAYPGIQTLLGQCWDSLRARSQLQWFSHLWAFYWKLFPDSAIPLALLRTCWLRSKLCQKVCYVMGVIRASVRNLIARPYFIFFVTLKLPSLKREDRI